MEDGPEPFESFWDIVSTADFITRRGYNVITLQFPDELLKQATSVQAALAQECQSRGHRIEGFVMADTTYNSHGVDEVAAQHVNAQCVVHYGRASLSPLSKLPAYFVFTRQALDCQATSRRITGWACQAHAGQKALLLLPDQPLAWALQGLKECLQTDLKQEGMGTVVVAANIPSNVLDPVPRSAEPASQHTLPAAAEHEPCHCKAAAAASAAAPSKGNGDGSSHESSAVNTGPAAAEQQAKTSCQAAGGECSVLPNEGFSLHSANEPLPEEAGEGKAGSHTGLAGLQWDLPEGIDLSDCLMLWLGDGDAPALTQLMLTYSRSDWLGYNPSTGDMVEGVPADISRILRRRYFLVEKARNANIIGIVVGTLGVAGFLQAAEEVRRLARAAGKKTYTLLMGKPNPAKLANFPEVEVFVMIADAQGMILDSKEYYAPIITPYEAQLAFTPEGAVMDGGFRLDFDSLLDKQQKSQPKKPEEDEESAPFSLVGGRQDAAATCSTRSADLALAQHASRDLYVQKDAGQLAEVKSAAQYLHARRSYRGLETPHHTGADAKEASAAVPGRSGRAAHYLDEPDTRKGET